MPFSSFSNNQAPQNQRQMIAKINLKRPDSQIIIQIVQQMVSSYVISGY